MAQSSREEQTHSILTGWINEPLMTLQERVKMKKPMTESQICIYCGKTMVKGQEAVILKNHPWFIIVNSKEPVGSQEMQDKVRNLCEGTLKAPLMLKRTRIKAGALVSLRKKWRQEG